jgi:hypothetical protein
MSGGGFTGLSLTIPAVAVGVHGREDDCRVNAYTYSGAAPVAGVM